jgi:predicted nucleotidyltransferase
MKKEAIFRNINEYLVRKGAKEISVFGSYSRDDFNKNSDIDLLVDFDKKKSLLDLVIIEQELSELLGIKVDLHTKNSISPHLIDEIIHLRKVIYKA